LRWHLPLYSTSDVQRVAPARVGLDTALNEVNQQSILRLLDEVADSATESAKVASRSVEVLGRGARIVRETSSSLMLWPIRTPPAV
jgi:hypothetical protein